MNLVMSVGSYAGNGGVNTIAGCDQSRVGNWELIVPFGVDNDIHDNSPHDEYLSTAREFQPWTC